MTGAADVAHALGLRRAGSEYIGQCPCCGYKTGFSVTDRKGELKIYCAAGGCEQRDLWAMLRKMGLAPDREAHDPYQPRKRARKATKPAENSDDKQAAATAIWQRSQLISGTIGESYLRFRGYTGPIPSVLRLARGKHPASDGYHPMLVAAVILENRLVAIHRTFLRTDGRGKAALEPDKMTLGPCKGGAVPLAPTASVIAVSEGIESGLSFMQLTGTPTWAALSTAGIRNLQLPPEVREVIVAVDPDIPGIRAARAAAERWITEGRRVRIARPPIGFDFNDLLLHRVA